jgi:hypothetical protein
MNYVRLFQLIKFKQGFLYVLNLVKEQEVSIAVRFHCRL